MFFFTDDTLEFIIEDEEMEGFIILGFVLHLHSMLYILFHELLSKNSHSFKRG